MCIYHNYKDLNSLINPNQIYKHVIPTHLNLLVKNRVGLKNLYKIISDSHTNHFQRIARVMHDVLELHREGILVGSGCYESEVFIQARSKEGQELTNIINFYDYVEVQPMDAYSHMLDTSDFAKESELLEHLRDEFQLSLLFISHDLNVIAQICDCALVLYQGKVVEEGTICDIFDEPKHEYTKCLLGNKL